MEEFQSLKEMIYDKYCKILDGYYLDKKEFVDNLEILDCINNEHGTQIILYSTYLKEIVVSMDDNDEVTDIEIS